MLFTDQAFLFYFLPFALICHRLAVGTSRGGEYPMSARAVFFLLTLVFYGAREPWWLVPFGLSVAFDFLWGTLIAREERPGMRRLLLVLSVVQNVTLLGVFKYGDFIVRNLSRVSPGAASLAPVVLFGDAPPTLPPGISFYTFESLSFVIDVYRRKIRPPRNPLTFFAFIGMFPRFIAGPIVRYHQIEPQFRRFRGMDIENGAFLFALGLFLKAVFADSYAVFVPTAYHDPADSGFLWSWIGVVSYTMEMYFDFSGYSLMAIGLGRMMGFQFPTNFNRPFLSRSLGEFWHRWHMTLSAWLRDYVYIPLGGNRGSPGRTALNLWITMFLGGIWHGARWGCLFWGCFHGTALALERYFAIDRKVPAAVGRAYTLAAFGLGLIFFNGRGLEGIALVFRNLFSPWRKTFDVNAEMLLTNQPAIFLCLAGFVWCFVVEPRIDEERLENIAGLTIGQKGAAFALLALTVLWTLSSSLRPFLYYQF